MPGVYTPPDFDLAGFIVGAVEEDEVLGPDRVAAGDVLLGFESSGLHTNGYSLARRIVAERLHLAPDDPFPGSDRSTADVLLAVHRSYLAALGPVTAAVHAMAHITGGGIPGNLDRALPPHLDAVIETSSWEVPPVFRVLADAGRVARDEMLRAFNMGVGLIAITGRDAAARVQASAASAGVRSWILGHVERGEGRVRLR
jgi:phosphoribosylformylglycinamidine cyclo-ligase